VEPVFTSDVLHVYTYGKATIPGDDDFVSLGSISAGQEIRNPFGEIS
jgi:hypothetical protein